MLVQLQGFELSQTIRPVLEARGYREGVPRGHRALHPLALEVARQRLVLQ